MIQQFSDYQAPPAEPHRQDVASLESDQGTIMLRPTRFGLGYRLHEDSEGFGQTDVDNDLTPHQGQRGAMLGAQRELEGDMMLAIIISSTSNTEVKRLTSELSRVLKPADGTIRVILTDPVTGEGRYRDIAYRSGLKTPAWSSPTLVRYDIVADFLDPWAYSTHEGQVTLDVAPGASGGIRVPIRPPVRVSRSPGAVDRWGTNDGEQPAPITLRFNGPVNNPEVALQGHWTFSVDGSLEWDEYLIVDPRTATAYIYSTTRPSMQRSAYSMIRTGSRFRDLILPPGQHAFTFRAIDPTFTASMTATWPHTYRSMH